MDWKIEEIVIAMTTLREVSTASQVLNIEGESVKCKQPILDNSDCRYLGISRGGNLSVLLAQYKEHLESKQK